MKHSQLLQDYFNTLTIEEGEYSHGGESILINELISSRDMYVLAGDDLGIDEPQQTYWNDLGLSEQGRLADNAADIDGDIFEVIVPTEDDILAIYLIGTDEESLLADLKKRYEALGRGDM
jgi:hypothetical protein